MDHPWIQLQFLDAWPILRVLKKVFSDKLLRQTLSKGNFCGLHSQWRRIFSIIWPQKEKKKNSNLEKGLWGKKEGANRDLNLVDWPHFLLVKMASSKIFPSPFSSACQLVKFKRESTNLPKVCTFGDVYSFLKLMMRKHKVLCQVETAATFHISKNHTVGTQGLLSLLSNALYLNNSNGTLCRVFTSKVYWAC